MIDAYLNDPDVIEAMCAADDVKPSKPSLFGWTSELAALKDIQDQMIASRGGAQFVPRPVIPGRQEKIARADKKLTATVSKLLGSD